jgi:hypothetical protein
MDGDYLIAGLSGFSDGWVNLGSFAKKVARINSGIATKL